MSAVRHTSQVRVRYAETDCMGVVNNGVYLAYWEVARTELLRSCGLPYTELEKAGILLPLREAHVEYLRPGRYDDLIDLTATIEDFRSAMVEIRYEARRGHELLARGFTKHPFVDSASFRPVRPPKIFIDALERSAAEYNRTGSNS